MAGFTRSKVRNFIQYRREVARRMRTGASLTDWSVAEVGKGLRISCVSYRPLLTRLESSWYLEWASISEVVAFKPADFNAGKVWLSFGLGDRSEVSVPEDASGWAALLDRLPEVLPGALNVAEWWPAVVRSEFAPNATRIYPPPTNSFKPNPLRGSAQFRRQVP